jgi:hypothetical protein
MMMRMKGMTATGLIAAVFALAIVASVTALAGSALAQTAQPAASASPSPQVPQPPEGGVNWSGAGWGAAALASNVVYIPAKLVYGVLGGLVGGASWALTGGNTQTADTIWRSSLGGDYVVTPDMLQGKQPVHFSGPTATPPAASGIQPLSQQASAGGAGASGQTGGLGVSGAPAASATPGSTSASAGAGTPYAASQPIDHGSGPVGGSPASAPSALPSTSIE